MVWLQKKFLRIIILKNVIFWTWLTQNSLNVKSMVKFSISVTSVGIDLVALILKIFLKDSVCIWLLWCILSEVMFLSDKIVFFCN